MCSQLSSQMGARIPAWLHIIQSGIPPRGSVARRNIFPICKICLLSLRVPTTLLGIMASPLLCNRIWQCTHSSQLLVKNRCSSWNWADNWWSDVTGASGWVVAEWIRYMWLSQDTVDRVHRPENNGNQAWKKRCYNLYNNILQNA